LLNKHVANHLTAIPENAATLRAERAEQEKTIAEQKQFGLPATQKQVAIDEEKARLSKDKAGFLERASSGFSRGIAYTLGGSPEDIKAAGEAGQNWMSWEGTKRNAAMYANLYHQSGLDGPTNGPLPFPEVQSFREGGTKMDLGQPGVSADATPQQRELEKQTKLLEEIAKGVGQPRPLDSPNPVIGPRDR
jgi:hypothetical protein